MTGEVVSLVFKIVINRSDKESLKKRPLDLQKKIVLQKCLPDLQKLLSDKHKIADLQKNRRFTKKANLQKYFPD